MTSPAAGPPERCYCVYQGERLVLVYRESAGPVFPSFDPVAGPVVERSRFRGQCFSLDLEYQLLKHLRQAIDGADLVKRLERAGLRVRLTPVSAVEKLLHSEALGTRLEGPKL